MKTQTSSAWSDTAAHKSRDPEQEKKGSESPPVKKSVRAEDGLNLVCEVRGQGDTALVFLHGWGGDREYWKHQVGVFAADYRVVALDQAGHSESGKGRKAWTADSLAGDVETVVKALGLKRVILVGHSMAGWVALLAAERMPGTVVAVIGVDTLQNAEFKLSEEVRKSIFDGVEKDFKGAVRTMFDGQFPEKADPEVKKWVQTKAAGQDPKMAIALMRDLFSLDTGKLLKEAKVPVRCINSAGGYKSFTPTVVETNKKYADFGAVTIDGVGHYPMLEKPDEFNHKLRDVLKEFATKKGNKENAMRKSYWFLGHHQTILAGAADTEGRYDLAEGRFPAGTQIPPHVHRRYSEHFYVLEGELTVWAGRRKVVLRPGDDLFIPPRTPHTFHVTGKGPWRALAVAAPSGFARLVSEVGTPGDGRGVPPSAPTDMELLRRVSAELGDEILGPPGALPE